MDGRCTWALRMSHGKTSLMCPYVTSLFAWSKYTKIQHHPSRTTTTTKRFIAAVLTMHLMVFPMQLIGKGRPCTLLSGHSHH